MLLAVSSYTVNAHSVHKDVHCKPPYTTLYVYTYPVQKECVLLKHASNVSALNKSNTEYNAGIVAYPVGHTRSFCAGWNTTACNDQR
jgi:hypothetical protein